MKMFFLSLRRSLSKLSILLLSSFDEGRLKNRLVVFLTILVFLLGDRDCLCVEVVFSFFKPSRIFFSLLDALGLLFLNLLLILLHLGLDFWIFSEGLFC